ncbi:ribonuclease H-like domain-containing protein, partial [Cunninghamella echinulata]
GNILLDEYVKPDEPIVDHLTEYSGITPELMKEATCSLRRAQKHIRKIVDHNVILIGHSLDSDLNALQIAHPYCADTSLLYDSHRGPPYKPSLKHLATIYLKRMIQVTNKETKGHNSAEDALATMDLFKLKVKNGFMFGRKKNDMEMIFDRLQRHQVPKKGMILESNNGIQTFQSGMGVHYENVATDEKLTQELIQHLSLKDQNFILAKYDNLKFRDLEDDDVPPVVISSVTVDKVRAKKLSMFDQSIKQIYDEAPKNTAIVVMGGLGYVPNYTRLLKKYNKYKEFMQLRKTGEEDIEEKTWTKEDQAELEMESKKAKLSCTFVTIK